MSIAFLAAFVVFLFHASVDWMWESTAVTVLAFAGVAAVGTRLSERRLRLRFPARAGLALTAAIAGSIAAASCVFDTAISVTSAGSRPTSRQARATSARTSSRPDIGDFGGVIAVMMVNSFLMPSRNF